jgi:hypothetical protein
MRTTTLALVIVSLALATAGPAVAGYGAVAYDQDARKQGSAWDEDTQQRANDAALKDCGSNGCKVRFGVPPGKCGGLATPESGNSWGGAVRDKLDAARVAAIKNCQKRAKGECKIRENKCNK